MDDGSALDWLARADEDLLISALLLPHGLFNGVAWHAQQAVEKALKAALVHAGTPPPKLHDLVLLGTRCADAGFPVPDGWIAPCRELTPMATVTRYPGWGHVDREQAARFHTDATAILAVVRGWLGGRPPLG